MRQAVHAEADFIEPLRRSIKEPIPEIFEAWQFLSIAADAHIAGDHAAAEDFFRQANMREVWDWVNPAWGPSPRDLALNVRSWNPEGDTRQVPKLDRDPRRSVPPEVKTAVLSRDGYRCRYCGIPVVDAGIRKIAHSLYPQAVPWNPSIVTEQHAAFQCLWLQYDHVVPHSHGGPSSEENVVVTCGLCNYGKDKYTLKQLGISDPRLRSPKPSPWDGIERLRAFGTT